MRIMTARAHADVSMAGFAALKFRLIMAVKAEAGDILNKKLREIRLMRIMTARAHSARYRTMYRFPFEL